MARILPEKRQTLATHGISLVHYPAYQNHRQRMHSVDVLLLSCILGGRGTHYIENDRFDEASASVSVINYGQEHDIVTDGPMEIVNVFLDLDRAPMPDLPFELRSILPSVLPLHRNLQHKLNRVVHLPFGNDELLRPILLALRDELRGQRVGSHEVVRALFTTFLIRSIRVALAEGVAPIATDRDDVMERVRQHISLHFADHLTLEQLADLAGMSRPYLCRRFKKYTGRSVFAYLLDRRLESAMVRLRSTNDKIVSVALECGFGDVAFFNRKFRERIGTRPGRYRRINSQTSDRSTVAPANSIRSL